MQVFLEIVAFSLQTDESGRSVVAKRKRIKITKKASKRFYFLTQLMRAGVPKQDLALLYVSSPST